MDPGSLVFCQVESYFMLAFGVVSAIYHISWPSSIVVSSKFVMTPTKHFRKGWVMVNKILNTNLLLVFLSL